jgi:hypothetical protein
VVSSFQFFATQNLYCSHACCTPNHLIRLDLIGLTAPNFNNYPAGAHPVSYPMGTRDSFAGGEAAGAVKLTTHLHLVPRSRMRAAIPPLPQYAFMAWCLVKHRDNFTFSTFLSWRF